MGRYGYWVVDGDGHVAKPEEMWGRFLEPKYRDAAPRVVTDNRGVSIDNIFESARRVNSGDANLAFPPPCLELVAGRARRRGYGPSRQLPGFVVLASLSGLVGVISSPSGRHEDVPEASRNHTSSFIELSAYSR